MKLSRVAAASSSKLIRASTGDPWTEEKSLLLLVYNILYCTGFVIFMIRIGDLFSSLTDARARYSAEMMTKLRLILKVI